MSPYMQTSIDESLSSTMQRKESTNKENLQINVMRDQTDHFDGDTLRATPDAEYDNEMFLRHVSLTTKSAKSNTVTPKNEEI